MNAASHPTAVVMNMFYTGLGIARSLGQQGISVIGLSAHPKCYGNFTRFARTISAPDSRTQPKALLDFLLDLGKKFEKPAIIFPTRDDDVLFLDHYREELGSFYSFALPETPVLMACMNKWETFQWARRTGVSVPNTWVVSTLVDIERLSAEIQFPAVLKPVSANEWRQGENWEIVGGRKAIGVSSRDELLSEYVSIMSAGQKVLIQEMVPGGDDCLVIVACYLDKKSTLVASFNTQKLLQSPKVFGTGCIVQSAECPELFERTKRLLETMKFTGIAEVEYKWDSRVQDYQLIEINPRPWDQHTLGTACGIDLVSFAYSEQAGLPFPKTHRNSVQWKWIAEDAFVLAALRSALRNTVEFREVFQLARGHRIFAMWASNDPKPFLSWVVFSLVPLLCNGISRIGRKVFRFRPAKKEVVYGHFQKGKNHT